MKKSIQIGLTGEPVVLSYLDIVAEDIADSFYDSIFLSKENEITISSKLEYKDNKNKFNICYSPFENELLNSKGVYFLSRKNPFDEDNDAYYVGSTCLSFRKRFSKIIQYIHGVFHKGDKNLRVSRMWRERYGTGNTQNMYVVFFPLNTFSKADIRQIESKIIKNLKRRLDRRKFLNVVEYATSAYMKKIETPIVTLCDFIT